MLRCIQGKYLLINGKLRGIGTVEITNYSIKNEDLADDAVDERVIKDNIDLSTIGVIAKTKTSLITPDADLDLGSHGLKIGGTTVIDSSRNMITEDLRFGWSVKDIGYGKFQSDGSLLHLLFGFLGNLLAFASPLSIEYYDFSSGAWTSWDVDAKKLTDCKDTTGVTADYDHRRWRVSYNVGSYRVLEGLVLFFGVNKYVDNIHLTVEAATASDFSDATVICDTDLGSPYTSIVVVRFSDTGYNKPYIRITFDITFSDTSGTCTVNQIVLLQTRSTHGIFIGKHIPIDWDTSWYIDITGLKVGGTTVIDRSRTVYFNSYYTQDQAGNTCKFLTRAATAPNTHFHFFADYVKPSDATDITVFFGYNAEIRTFQFYSKWSGTNTRLLTISYDGTADFAGDLIVSKANAELKVKQGFTIHLDKDAEGDYSLRITRSDGTLVHEFTEVGAARVPYLQIMPIGGSPTTVISSDRVLQNVNIDRASTNLPPCKVLEYVGPYSHSTTTATWDYALVKTTWVDSDIIDYKEFRFIYEACTDDSANGGWRVQIKDDDGNVLYDNQGTNTAYVEYDSGWISLTSTSTLKVYLGAISGDGATHYAYLRRVRIYCR